MHAVRSLKSLLATLNDETTNPQSSLQRLSPAQQGELKALLEECDGGLREVAKVLQHYRSLDTKGPRFRDQLAFTTGKQTALRERIRSHSERIQQFLSGINVVTFSRVERNTEAQLALLSKIEARLDRIHRELLQGRRDPSLLDGDSAAASLEHEVLREDESEVGVDISHVVSHWLGQIRHEHETGTIPSPGIFNLQSDGSASIPSKQYDSSSPEAIDIEHPKSPADFSPAIVAVESPPAQRPSQSPPATLGQPAQPQQNRPVSSHENVKIDHFIDVRLLKPQRTATPHRQAGYDHSHKKGGRLSYYSTTLEQYTYAIVVPIKVSEQELREGTTRTTEITRNVFKKSASREEKNVVTVDVEPQKKHDHHCVIYKCMGNRTMRDSRLVRGAEVLVDAEHVVFRFHCS